MAYSLTTSLSLGGDPPSWEGEVEVIFQVSWGRPEQGPTYSHGGQPAEDDQVEVLEIGLPTSWAQAKGMADVVKVVDQIIDHLQGSPAYLAEMLAHAREVEAGRADAADEDRRERLREEL